jgi:solute carrier family 25, member 33/36
MAQHQSSSPVLPSGDDRPFHHSKMPADHSALIQSRETGVVVPDEDSKPRAKGLPFAKSWVHLMAGG